MDFRLEDALPVLERTPAVLRTLLGDLPEAWTSATEGPGTWSPFDIVGHLIHGERTDWVPRVRHLLRFGDGLAFEPFDREAMFRASQGKSLRQLLDTFAELRAQSLTQLTDLRVTVADLAKPGLHPELGPVTLGQLLATWVLHDLSHVSQVARVMARQYDAPVGPWKAYFPILTVPR
ncbi:MAG TPA: DinB family protein [Gemmatimonadaceae bacterium]|nr:DinB family protein [Gemmatimonadaceae bacterium]